MTTLRTQPRLTLSGLKERLGREVHHQPAAVHSAACLLMQALSPIMAGDEAELVVKPRIMTTMLFGPSGCGKTQLALSLQALLKEQGVPSLRFDASTCKNETSVTRFTGAGAGYEGCQDTNTLPDMLADLLVDPEKRRIERMNKTTREFREAADRYNTNIPAPPRLLYIFIDEIDKAHHDLLIVLNGLLDRGEMSSARGRLFQPSPETTLFFVFTSNYADQELCAMGGERHTERAQELAREAMAKRGLQYCTIERFGELVPFYPLQEAQLRDVLYAKLERHIARPHTLCERFGAIVYPQDVKDRLVGRVASRAKAEGGLRRAMRELFRDLDMIYVQASDVLAPPPPPPPGGGGEGDGDDGPLTLFVHDLALDKMDKLKRTIKGAQIARLLADEMNTEQLCLYQRRYVTTALALGLHSDTRVLVYRVLPLLCDQSPAIMIVDETNALRRENRMLKRLLHATAMKKTQEGRDTKKRIKIY